MPACWPWFSAQYRALDAEAWTKAVIKAGASADASGNVPIAPETLRARAETYLAQNAPQGLAMIGGRLSLETYTYARYMASEALGNSSTVEERVADGEALRNRSGIFGKSIYKLLTPSGYYGPIHGPGGTSTAPYGRWAATSRDPSVMTILLAHLVTSGASGDFAQGADDQAAVNTQAWVSYLAKNGKFWVGPLPGVDHRRTFLVFTPGPVQRVAEGKALLERGLAAIGKPPEAWPDASQVCNKPLMSRRAQSFFVAMLGLAVGTLAGHLASKRYLHTS
jgi:hypothetical protein